MYSLITTRNGQVPIEEIKEGTEVLCAGRWKVSPDPVRASCIKCSFDSLPTTVFEKQFIENRYEVSACHNVILAENDNIRPELSILGYFKEDKKSTTTVFKGLEDLTYWLPRFIKLYDEPMMPAITNIGFSLNHSNKEFDNLTKDDLTERNLEYVLEGILRRSFGFYNCKYHIPHTTQWSELHRITLRLLNIECDVFQSNDVAIRNPIQLYKHIRDDYNKTKITENDIVYNLRRDYRLPEYTSGYVIKGREEVEDWVLPGINPDVNTLNPDNNYNGAYFYNKDKHYLQFGDQKN